MEVLFRHRSTGEQSLYEDVVSPGVSSGEAVDLEGFRAGNGRLQREGSLHDRRDRHRLAAPLLHPHPLAPLLRRRPRPEMDPPAHSPCQ
ncbi:hypothetical protein BHE74_00056496 [Ensete ventricosum]|uniref:Uncharacterized protein n=1 Tax=Ensete ventricosum TaxID=4639 RepID=A0A426YEW5_ENSVE|nr:hypothetical protein B296_00011482 [Ensete ventricosum]RWW29072.1 hypothetical protein GW17_00006434 [Ensete ventricosum]RWW38285.1 hypothetical protein BHE74_00056496 [Ensete ventricosum]RZR81162.1 hypothetical protein BHM03_00007345 [Ensete ventricosum]